MSTLSIELPKKIEERLSEIPHKQVQDYMLSSLEQFLLEQEVKARSNRTHPLLEEVLEERKHKAPLTKTKASKRLAELSGTLNEY